MPRRTYDPRNGRRRVIPGRSDWTWLLNELAARQSARVTTTGRNPR